jgi:YidC/Oxa1 family membrane protein insertase
MDRTQIILLVVAVGLFLLSVQMGGLREPAAVSTEQAPPRTEQRGGGAQATGEGGHAETARNPDSSAEEEENKEQVSLSNEALAVTVANEGARIRSVRLLRYADRIGQGAEPVDLATDEDQGLLSVSLGASLPRANVARYHMVEHSERSVEYVLGWSSGAEVAQRLELDAEGYGAELTVEVRNRGQGALQAEFAVALFGRDPPQTGTGQSLQNHRLAALEKEGGSLVRQPLASLERARLFSGGGPLRRSVAAPVSWVAVESQYFLAAVVGDGSGHGAYLRSLGPGAGEAALVYPQREIGPGQEIERRYRLYLGPKVEGAVEAVDGRLDPALVVGYAWVRPITRGFAYLLNWLHNHVLANYGAGIIVITLLLRLAMYPLTQKSMQSMRRMNVVAPQLKEIQGKYRDDPQRQQQELMALYQRAGINPVTALGSGCLPMMLQMPFMVALYFALQGMIELRQAPFVLWVKDLSAPESFLTLFGVELRPLTLLMGGSMFLQTYLQPGSSDPQQQQQRQMMLIMSGVFVLMFYSFPSGLVLYWLVSNLLGIAQQVLINRVRAKA